MTRRIVYGMGLWATAAVTAMTIASIIMPNWIRWNNGTENSPRFTYGLHKRCSSVTGQCEPFPDYADCHRDQSFCGMWRSVAFLMSFAVLLELATLVAYIIIILGGQQLRQYGWKVVVSLLAAVVLVQCSGMAIIAYLFDHDERFFPGWQLDTSWILCTVSWTVALATGAGICTAVYALPEEGGYELIPGEN
ncbi:hypothetical protein Vi05172_g9740 [Venturia inaequalis]|uniref:Uncharacterized protein n=1 Tax=Venturia inaequalis TaxID=5025 RepID=A0A8H3VDQ9_VENIN|nr:hypothetical protein EG327_004608 [Venturia inaequalis]RDI80277.1 hypothetical protein Vi05172_g9740 [Venturia inaequalis]